MPVRTPPHACRRATAAYAVRTRASAVPVARRASVHRQGPPAAAAGQHRYVVPARRPPHRYCITGEDNI